MPPTFKQLLATGELIPIFAVGRMPHPVVIEIFGLAGGYRGFWMDQEHCAVSTEQVAIASLAARANDFKYSKLASQGLRAKTVVGSGVRILLYMGDWVHMWPCAI